MTTIDHFQTAPATRDHSALPSIIVGVVLLLLLGVPALMAPATPAATLDWHGNAAILAQ